MRSEFSDDMGFAENQLRWFVAYVRARCEEQSAIGLQRRGFEVFRPVYRVKVSLRRRVLGPNGRTVQMVPTELKRALFPRYLFVGLSADRSCWDLLQVDGVEYLLQNNGVPSVVPYAAIEDLRVGLDMGLFDLAEDTPPTFRAGEDVRIAIGAHANFPARVRAMLPDGMAEIVTRIFDREVDLTLPLDRLRQSSSRHSQ